MNKKRRGKYNRFVFDRNFATFSIFNLAIALLIFSTSSLAYTADFSEGFKIKNDTTSENVFIVNKEGDVNISGYLYVGGGNLTSFEDLISDVNNTGNIGRNVLRWLEAWISNLRVDFLKASINVTSDKYVLTNGSTFEDIFGRTIADTTEFADWRNTTMDVYLSGQGFYKNSTALVYGDGFALINGTDFDAIFGATIADTDTTNDTFWHDLNPVLDIEEGNVFSSVLGTLYINDDVNISGFLNVTSQATFNDNITIAGTTNAVIYNNGTHLIMD